ncbi:hypothetical protein PISMIDRAFT_679160 [Pisolithus microcarpus 441]|uniref:Uncharacterized protein n=1 Tax=Pisolithus microcarpus 441 TaxID=765257 RepID=A0A0C9ZMA6_9AGAM|nr:hypothetical protein PISMIDRAFT_679160 [Pisolithus microcarpus 441]
MSGRHVHAARKSIYEGALGHSAVLAPTSRMPCYDPRSTVYMETLALDSALKLYFPAVATALTCGVYHTSTSYSTSLL